LSAIHCLSLLYCCALSGLQSLRSYRIHLLYGFLFRAIALTLRAGSLPLCVRSLK